MLSDSEASSSSDSSAPLQEPVLPFCLSDIPPELDTDDPVNQEDLLIHLYRNSDNDLSFEQTFETLQIRKLTVSALERQYKQLRSAQAISSLRTRTQVVLERDSTYKTHSPDVSMSCDQHFLDFFMAVGSGMGMDAVLPAVDVDHTWTFNMDVTQPFRQWRMNYGRLGFETAGRMLYFGRRAQEDVWVAFAPLAFIQNTLDNRGEGGGGGGGRSSSSTVHTLRYRRFLMFINYCLHRMAFEDFTMSTQYPDVTTNATANEHSNIL
jgi:hypothetical protein